MATPKSGPISFSQLNVEILQNTNNTQVELNDAAIRMGYTSTGQVSMANLAGCFGATVTCANYPGDTFLPSQDGYSGVMGSIDDNLYTSNGVVGSSNATIDGVYSDNSQYSGSNTIFVFDGAPPLADPPSGFCGNNVTRACIANTARTIQANTQNETIVEYNMPSTGTVTIGLKFV